MNPSPSIKHIHSSTSENPQTVSLIYSSTTNDKSPYLKHTHLTLPAATLKLTNKTMCSYRRYKSHDCKHSWLVVSHSRLPLPQTDLTAELQIKTPCRPGGGFDNCPRFNGGHADYPSRQYWADKENCPWHGLKGDYDSNYVRMVEKIRPRVFGMSCGVM